MLQKFVCVITKLTNVLRGIVTNQVMSVGIRTVICTPDKIMPLHKMECKMHPFGHNYKVDAQQTFSNY